MYTGFACDMDSWRLFQGCHPIGTLDHIDVCLHHGTTFAIVNTLLGDVVAAELLIHYPHPGGYSLWHGLQAAPPPLWWGSCLGVLPPTGPVRYL